MIIQGHTAIPLDKLRADWLPVCSDSRYHQCHKAEHDCAFDGVSNKACRPVTIEIREKAA